MLTRTALGQSSLYSSLARLTADTSGVKAFVRDGQHIRQLCSSSIRLDRGLSCALFKEYGPLLATCRGTRAGQRGRT